MEENFEPGDILTFRLHGDDFGLAHLLYVENLATIDHYHLAILDAVFKAEDGGYDSYGVLANRSERLDEDENVPVAIDHIALNLDAFTESSPAKVDFREVTDEDIIGYRVWLHQTHQKMMRQGLIVEREREEVEEDVYEMEEDEEELIDEELGHPDEPGSVEEELDALDREEGEEELYEEFAPDTSQQIEVRPWHNVVYDRPLSEVLIELNTELAKPEFDGLKLAGYIRSFFDGSNGEAIEELVNRLIVEGDYSAGHELTAFGDPAADALARHLQDGMDPQLADDIVNILCDMGSLRGYEHIANFFLQHEGNPDDPLALSAARGFAYAVMLTAGTPDPLRAHLSRLNDISFPELAHDVAAAKEAVANLGEKA